MARTFTSPFQTVLNSNTIKYFFLIHLKFVASYQRTSEVNNYFTSHSSDIFWSGQTWTSDGGLFEVDAPNFSSIVDREAYRVVITDLSNEFSDEFKKGVVGSPIKVYIGLLNSNGIPLTGTGDIVNLYSGYIDTPSIKIDWDTKYATLEGTSPLSDLDQVKSILVSKSGMDNFNLGDTSYDQLYDDSEIRLKWGKT
jgi:hypothetical protein